MAKTQYQRTVDALLKAKGHAEGLDGFVLARRPEASWRSIATDLREATEGTVDLTDVTLSNWYGDRAAA